MNIAVVIVNYRTPDLVIECLRSLEEEVAFGTDLRVFVGDADSGDSSDEKISAFIANNRLTWATCFPIGKNGGFAYGNNHIIRTHVLPNARFDYVHFLNPDTYIRPGAVRVLADFLRQHPAAGVVGSRLENPDGTGRSFGFRQPNPWREFFRGAKLDFLFRLVPSASITIENLSKTQKVGWVTGASFMVPRPVLEKVGLMDDRYFLYFEETDLMVRIREAGYEVWHIAESKVVHLAGQATGVRAGAPGRKKRLSPHWLKSRSLFFRNHYGRAGALLGTLLFLLGDVFYRAHRLLLGRPISDPPHLWHDYLAAEGLLSNDGEESA